MHIMSFYVGASTYIIGHGWNNYTWMELYMAMDGIIIHNVIPSMDGIIIHFIMIIPSMDGSL